jgi:hypothetical protein
MTLFRYSPPASEQVGVNHAFGVTGLELRVLLTRIRPRAMPPIFLNLQKSAHFRIGNSSVRLLKLWMDTEAIKGVFHPPCCRRIFRSGCDSINDKCPRNRYHRFDDNRSKT